MSQILQAPRAYRTIVPILGTLIASLDIGIGFNGLP
jgi:hypothetical protein